MQFKTPNFIKYTWKNSAIQILIVLGFSLLVVFLIWNQCTPSKSLQETFANFLDPGIAFGTLLIAVLVWGNEKRRNWHSYLPKKLNVIYLLKEDGEWKMEACIWDAPLAGESDIRAWGQSIGQTSLGMGRLPFTGFRIVEQGRKGTDYYYGVLFFLSTSISEELAGEYHCFDENGMYAGVQSELPVQDHFVHQLLNQIPN